MAAQMIMVAVVGHQARQHQAQRLAAATGARLFLDNGQLGEWANHRRAWLWLAQQQASWGLVLQDDAAPIPGALGHLQAGLGSLPCPGLVSLYLGTSYPPQWQRRIRSMLARCGAAPWARSSYLLHGVAVAAPIEWAAEMVGPATAPLPYDEQLGMWARGNGRPVFYTLPSLVQHVDGPTLVRHHDGRARDLPRQAWRLGVPDWRSRAVVEL